MMKSFFCFLNKPCLLMMLVVFLASCATSPKRMEPVTTADDSSASSFLGRMEIVEQPELEADWADWVKDRYPNWRTHYWVDRGQWGNRGYIFGRAPSTDLPLPDPQMDPLPPALGTADLAPLAIIDEQTPEIEIPEQPTTYTVIKGDSLWKIAGRVYGNPLKWPKIYRANNDKIKNPHRIYPGQVLTIPRD